ncbi:MAG: beta-galactosidase [Candidatus Hydrogenedentes bacterium]|nr:beta-galactosidase [Candidatus Hydrogenedentota bacterium]
MRRVLVCTILAAALSVGAAAADDDVMVLGSFDARKAPDTLTATDAQVRPVKVKGEAGRALRVQFAAADRPEVILRPETGAWDLSAYSGLAIDATNPEDGPVELFIRVDSLAPDGKRQSARGTMTLPAGETTIVRFYFTNSGAGPYWGMRGVPVRGPVVMFGPGLAGFSLEPSKVTGIRLYLMRPERAHELIIDNVRAFKPGDPLEQLVPNPFIDRYGQYIHDEWPGKVHSDEELAALHRQEEKALEGARYPPGYDRFGGWAEGPQLEATGWFRTEQVDGKWWLVTPEGHLFFSIGVDCVGFYTDTFVTGRDDWFEWVPKREEEFGEFRGHRIGAHSMAEPIGSEGDTFCFYRANLKRRFGDDWNERACDLAVARLKAWGFNTVANWSDGRILHSDAMPFTATSGTGGPVVEGTGGFWGKMVDVFDPEFTRIVDERAAGVTSEYKMSPMLIGYFMDNEMSWQSIAKGVLDSPPTQVARRVFVADLKAKYETLDRLNAAWNTTAESWDALRVPIRLNDACLADSTEFEYKFARRYFDTVAGSLRKYDPSHLYLGCRGTLRYWPPIVAKACAEVADVVSVNVYLPDVRSDSFRDLGKPYIIGEFHFGALDTGMFHQGLQPTANQHERGEKYAAYVKSVAESPLFVGCHWFRYSDQATTGRASDGENYNIGLVMITDVPYEEFLKAVCATNAGIYTSRAGAK